MSWQDFRAHFDRTFRGKRGRPRPGTMRQHQTALDRFEQIVRPTSLAEFTTANVTEAATTLESGFVLPDGRPIAPVADASVACRLKHLRLIANWANRQGLLPEVPRFEIHAGNKAKGRPITSEEYGRMLAATDAVCGRGAESYRELLEGLWLSGLRLSEILALRVGKRETGVSIELAGRQSRLWFAGQA